MDKGTLTLGVNRKVDFTQTMIFMTSNLGSQEMSQMIKGSIGFAPSAGARMPARAVFASMPVSPGPTRTEGTAAMDEGLEQLAAQAPAGRPATAEEIAEAIVFLATDRASFIQGAKLAVDGERTAV
jgi:hypothetical protein